MHYLALATDFDGTLAHDGHVADDTIAAVQKLRDSGRKLILVTGREIPDLRSTFPQIGMCDIVVAENGALLYWPQDDRERTLADPLLDEFILEIRRRGIAPFSVGKVILATWRPHEAEVLAVIQALGLEYQIIFNKDAVMVLPSGVNKATGLQAALGELSIDARNVVGIGDAENDTAFLKMCGCSAAVANALPSIKQFAGLVTPGDHGSGVSELIDRLVPDDLKSLVPLRRPAGERDGMPPHPPTADRAPPMAEEAPE
jgi:HAD superfamily hydrolase (TIGR01484 family)